MRTTVRLPEKLLEQARAEAVRRKTTLTALIEEGLRVVVVGGLEKAPRDRVKIPVSRASGGLLPGVDLNNSAALLDLMEGRD